MSEALQAAIAEGFPEELFIGLCEWLESYIVDSPTVEIRYSPNTRARALQACRHLGILRPISLWGQE